MPDGLMKNLFAALALLLLAVAPAALRASEGPPKWVLVRVGARPAQDDPNQDLVRQVYRDPSPVENKFDPIVFAIGLICLLGLLAGVPFSDKQGGRRTHSQTGPPAESGLRERLSSRAPPAFAPFCA